MTADEKTAMCGWIERTFPRGEALAIGGAFADGTLFKHGATPEFAACREDTAWRLIEEMVRQLAAWDCDARRSVWVFENGLFWIATRADGIWLGLFTGRELTEEAKASLHRRLNEFSTR